MKIILAHDRKQQICCSFDGPEKDIIYKYVSSQCYGNSLIYSICNKDNRKKVTTYLVFVEMKYGFDEMRVHHFWFSF